MPNVLTQETLDEIDENGDGFISMDEFLGRKKIQFISPLHYTALAYLCICIAIGLSYL
jgi:hypothetical protein